MKSIIFVLVFSVSVASCEYNGPKDAFVLANGISLYNDNSGKFEWLESLNIGDKLQVLGPNKTYGTGDSERLYDKVTDSVGKVGWVQDNLIAKGASLAAVQGDKTFLYSAPQDIKVTDRVLPRGTVLGIFPAKENSAFVKIMAYDPSRDRIYRDMYIKTSDLTQNAQDIQAAITLRVLKDTKSKEAWKALLMSSANLVSSPVFGQDFQQLLNNVQPVTTPQATTATGSYHVIQDSSVYDSPDMMNGKTVAQVTKGSQVQVDQESQDSYTINGVQGKWFHLVQPAGWVFGSTLQAVK